MKKPNKKGFTLAELLGVIVILLLLILIVTPIFIKYTKKASNSVYDVQINTIKASARAWAEDEKNIKLLPTINEECIEVSLEKLKELGYLDYNIKNPKTNEKFDDNLTVIIRKEGDTLTYNFNEDGTQVCNTVITTDYPKWVYVGSTPSVATSSDTVVVNITSDRAISEETLTPERITVKVGSQIIDDADVVVNCSGTDPLACELRISNLDGDGKLSLIIEKDTMKDTDLNPSRLTNIQTDTVVDSTGPKISYTGRENTNSSIYYATKDDTVTIKFKAEDNGSLTSNLTADDIKVFVGTTEVNCTKTLTQTGNGSTINCELKLQDVNESGKVSIKIASGKIIDNVGNTNNEKIITPGITFDNIKPTIEFTPNEQTRYLKDMATVINAYDNETGINEETLKYIFTTDINATPNTSISNGGLIEKSGVNGDYYVIGSVCDYAGNCTKVPSGIFHLNNRGPEIQIIPNSNANYAKSASVQIKVTSGGEALDEGSLKYIIAESTSADVDTQYTNNETVTIKNLSGVYYVIAEACDVMGNCTRKVSDPFKFDNAAPEVKYTPNGTYNNGFYYTKSINVAVKVTDNIELDWSKYAISTNKAADPGTSISNGSANVTVTSTNASGLYYVITKACDKLSNCRTVVSEPYYLDNKKPGIGTISVTPNTSTKVVTSSVTVTDNVALKKYEIYNPSGSKVVDQAISGTSKAISYNQNARGTYTLKVYDHLDNVETKTFTVPTYTVQFAVNDTNMGSVTNSSVATNFGANASTTFSAKAGYRYKSVSGTGCSVSGSTVTASSVTATNVKCTVNFEKNEFTVNWKSADTQTGTVATASQKVTYGNKGSTTISPTSYHKYSKVDCTNGVTASHSNGTVTTSAISTDTTCTVTFACNFTSLEFGYKGSIQSFTVPKACGGTYTLEVWGAQGGTTNGGKGGYSKATVSLTGGTTVYIGVGGAGCDNCSGAGYNGGGTGSAGRRRGSGGGATHIGKTNALLKNTAAGNLYIVAGGGGGGTYNEGGGDGTCSWASPSSAAGGAGSGGKYGSVDGNGNDGGATGYSAGCGNNCISTLAGGGTQTAGGRVGVGYDCMNPPTRYAGPNPGSYGQGGNGDDYRPGGGGGYYGGGSAGVGADYTAGGGGGSGYFGSGVTPTGSSKGVQSGNGKAKITKN